MVTTSLGQLADALFAARLGTVQAAAVGLVLPCLSLLQAVGYTIALGGSTLTARLLGEKKEEQAGQIAFTSLKLSVVVGLAAAGVTLLFAPLLVDLAGADTVLAPHASHYFKTAVLQLPFYAGAATLCMLLRAYGAPFGALTGILLGCAVQLIVSPWLMFGRRMGLAGAGFGMVIGQGTAFVVLLLLFCGRKRPVVARRPSLTNKSCFAILKNGVSSLARQGASAVAGVAVNRVAVGYGEVAVASLAAAGKVTGLLYSAFLGLGQGFLPLAGYYYGGKHHSRLKRAFWFSFWVGSIGLTVLAAVCFGVAPYLLALLSPDRMVQGGGTLWLKIQLLAMPMIPFGVLFNMAVQAVGRPVSAAFLACLRQGVCLWMFVKILPSVMGAAGLAWSYVAADFATLLISVICCQIIKRPIAGLHKSSKNGQ